MVFLQGVKERLSLFIILLIGVEFSSQAQYTKDDLDIFKKREQQVIRKNDSTDIASILTGKVYALRQTYSINSQFFNDANPGDASLRYDGVWIEHINMQYDLSTQQVIVLLKTKYNEKYVSIDSEKVTYFNINGSVFKKVTQDSLMADGIYQIAYAGVQSNLYIKRIKNRVEKISDKITVQFNPVNYYFVTNSLGTFSITSKNDFLNAYGNNPQIKNMLKEYAIKFNKHRIEEGLLTALRVMESKSVTE